jgi:hypothetical protein
MGIFVITVLGLLCAASGFVLGYLMGYDSGWKNQQKVNEVLQRGIGNVNSGAKRT